MKNLLVVIDYQNVALSYDPEKYGEELQHTFKAIQKTADLVDAIHNNNSGDVAWVAFAPNAADALGDGISGMHPDLLSRMQQDDFLFIKDTKSAFGSKDVTETLCFDDIVARGYDNIIITGTSVIDCLQRTIEDAVAAGLEDKIILPRDACSPSPAFTAGQDGYLSDLSKITVCSTDRLTRYLENGTPLEHIPFNKSAHGATATSANQDAPKSDQTPSQTSFSQAAPL